MTDMTHPDLLIQTDRLTLRPLRPSDVGLLELHAGDERVAKNTSTIPHPLPPGAAEAFVARVTKEERDEECWALDATAQGGSELMGVVYLKRLDDSQSEIGCWVTPAFWNTGLASDAIAAILGANPLNNKTIFASVFQDNPASARVLTNAGFDYIGDAETYCVSRDANVATWTYIRKLD